MATKKKRTKAATRPRRLPWAPVGREVSPASEPTNPSDHEVFELFTKLCGALVKDGGEANLAAMRAVRNVGNALALADLATLASMANVGTGNAKGRPAKASRAAALRFVRYVEASRATGLNDESIAIALCFFWEGELGPAPNDGPRVRSEIQALAAYLRSAPNVEAPDFDRRGAGVLFPTLRDAPQEEPKAFVRKVYQALGFSRSDNLFNASSKARSRAHRSPE